MAVHKEPNLLKGGIVDLIDVNSVNNDGLNKYQELFSNVRFAWQKTQKYEKYFADFYADQFGIDSIEALNHHIHAYLQDNYILREKIDTLFNNLGRDLRAIASNKEEVAEFIKAGKEKNKEVFEGVCAHRNPHTHSGRRFMDGDLLKAENAHESIKLFSETPMREMLNPDYKDEWFDKLKKEKEEAFESAKNRWVEMANTNNVQISGYLNDLLEAVKPSLFQFLKIKSSIELFDKLQEQNDKG